VLLRAAGFFATTAFFVPPARLFTIFFAGFAPAVFLAAPRAFLAVVFVVVADLPMPKRYAIATQFA
jgi:hypothetical protein